MNFRNYKRDAILIIQSVAIVGFSMVMMLAFVAQFA